jgi:hypothetical protein
MHDGNTAPDAKIAALTALAQPPVPSSSEELVKYLVVELDVPRENHVRFQDEMKNLVEVMFDYKRWELVFATYPIIGKVNRFIHIWKIPDESTVVEVMRAGALGTPHQAVDPGDAPNLEEQFRRCYQLVQSMIVDTRHTLVTSLPYDPNHVGYQSQTILIDAEGEPFVIDHDQLRTALDISSELEEVRQGKDKLRVRAGGRTTAPKSLAELARQEREGKPKPAKAPDNRSLKLAKIQEHLNRGSAVARLKVGKSHALLFNLAGLKPRSVFQRLDTAEQLAKEPSFVPKGGNQSLDLPVSEILIATPWGSVYELDRAALGKLTKPVKDENKAAVGAALKPIIEDDTPLAAIPEERDQLIGDGCACFVINLKSFVGSHAGAARAEESEVGSSSKQPKR